MGDYFAHKDQPLVDHLDEVGERAAGFADKFDAAAQGRVAGRLHDLGKAEHEFQRRIQSDDKDKTAKKEPHAHHGAALAAEKGAWPIAFAVNGHHAGLHDRANVDRIRSVYLLKAEKSLERLKERHPDWLPPTISEMLPPWLSKLPFDQRRTAEGWFAADVFTRFLFSALVDADSLNTEEHEKGHDLAATGRKWPDFDAAKWLDELTAELDKRTEKARSENNASTEVQKVWREVREACLAAARQEAGLFSMTVPTGGGKTLASMLFALAHAKHHNDQGGAKRPFRRIIVVIPYLSIIQQTVKELRGVFGDGVILEHHSQADEPDPKKFTKEKEDGGIDEKNRRRRLAAENWDAPIIVTTSVQFFDSLFSRRRSAARKLHNLCQSIVIFDEVQTLPPLMMQPILSVLAELTSKERPYGCSMVFCTATQPALGKSESLPCGLTDVRPIIPNNDVSQHFRDMARVDYEWPLNGETFTWEQLAAKLVVNPMQSDQQVLVVVNTRQAARDLHATVSSKLREGTGLDPNVAIDGLFHLSTWMMPTHRNQVLDEVRRRLDPPKEQQGQPRQRCILISTQCIEAGVDVDFPEVWRAFGPYDSIVQAGGRCNRRGKQHRGIVHVFQPAEPAIPTQGVYPVAVSQTKLLSDLGQCAPHDPESFGHYFRLLYQLSVPDEGHCGIQKERADLHFEKVDELFKFIDDNTFPILVQRQRLTGQMVDTPNESAAIYEAAERRGFFVREDWRRLQPFIINLLQSSKVALTFQRLPDSRIRSGLWPFSVDWQVSGRFGRRRHHRVWPRGLHNMISEPLRIRVRGPWACFTRPEFHVERVTYPVMTPSAARGVLEAILMKPIEKPEAAKRDHKIGFRWRILRIGIVKKGFLFPILRNELGYAAHNYSGYDISDTANVKTQRNSLILRDVEYLIEAAIEVPDAVRRLGEPFLIAKYQGMFERRVQAGQCFHRPYLGCREYPCDFEWAADAEATPMTERFGMMFRDFDFDPVWEFWPAGTQRPTRWQSNGRPVTPIPKSDFLAETKGDGWITVAEVRQTNGKREVIQR